MCFILVKISICLRIIVMKIKKLNIIKIDVEYF